MTNKDEILVSCDLLLLSVDGFFKALKEVMNNPTVTKEEIAEVINDTKLHDLIVETRKAINKDLFNAE